MSSNGQALYQLRVARVLVLPQPAVWSSCRSQACTTCTPLNEAVAQGLLAKDTWVTCWVGPSVYSNEVTISCHRVCFSFINSIQMCWVSLAQRSRHF